MNSSAKEIVSELQSLFDRNLSVFYDLEGDRLGCSIDKLRGIAAVGEILSSETQPKHHKICCQIFDEVFSDGVISTYLASNAIYKPAKIILRRILELGVASVYLWDMPHKAHAWNESHQDLNFREMMAHLTSLGYVSHVQSEKADAEPLILIEQERAQILYGVLSDVVHGKPATFDSSLADRFEFVEDSLSGFMTTMDEVLTMLLNLYINRFDIKDNLITKVPQLSKELT